MLRRFFFCMPFLSVSSLDLNQIPGGGSDADYLQAEMTDLMNDFIWKLNVSIRDLTQHTANLKHNEETEDAWLKVVKHPAWFKRRKK